MGLLRFCALLLALAIGAMHAAAADDASDPVETGRRIYELGELSSGAALRATRADGSVVTGRTIACIQCHRRSGMGAAEGLVVVPPIIGEALFGTFRRPGD